MTHPIRPDRRIMRALLFMVLLAWVPVSGCSSALDGITGPALTKDIAEPPQAQAPSQTKMLLEARKGFKTTLIKSNFKPDGPAPSPEGTRTGLKFKKIHYRSPAGAMVAYLSADPGDGKKHPVMIWAHGGFGGIGSSTWAKSRRGNDISMQAFLAKGMVVLVPSWRGENDNPGRFELFYGEVDDLLAALSFIKRVPYIDKSRIYLAGHSTGGTLALLAATATTEFRAIFSIGGAPDLWPVVTDGKGYGNTPFDHTNRQESFYRSAHNFVPQIKTPTFYMAGESSKMYLTSAKAMAEKAEKLDVPFTAFSIKGGTHFNILHKVKRVIAQKIARDTGPSCNIAFTPAELRLK